MLTRSHERWSTTRRLSCEQLEQRRLLAEDVTFEDPVTYPTGGLTAMAIAGDVNNDQIVDLIVGNFRCCGSPVVLLGNDDGTFAAPNSIGVRGGAVAVGDFDADGDLDVAATSHLDELQVSLNNGSSDGEWAGFARPQRFGFTGQSIASADFDADGDLDLVTGDADFVRVALNNGISDGQWDGFADPVVYRRGVSFPMLVKTGDLDGDGDVDVVAGNLTHGSVSVLLGNGDGTFVDAVRYTVVDDNAGVWSVSVADFNGDEHLDVAATLANTGRVAVLLGNGDGTFAQPNEFSVGHVIFSHTAADLDGDGDEDIVTVEFQGNRVGLLINNGDATFVEHEVTRFSQGQPQSVTAADLDGDGDPDVVVADIDNGVDVFLNTTEVDIPNAGDANRDGQFDQRDIVQVLQAGKYLTGQPAAFADGDWNLDGVFDQLDIIVALQTGSYLRGANAARSLAKSVDDVWETESFLDDLLAWRPQDLPLKYGDV